jgi:aspartyl-tRNA(Asn)/glutamyl-tRNA(Gln) amidotransferase subunit A
MFAYLDPTPPAAPAGHLAGQHIAIQANLSVRGWPTEAGSKALTGYCALEDATVVGRLRKAGAVLVGSLPTAEFGFGLDTDAAHRALVAESVQVALLTDILGEARLAAARAGVFGFKPTAGIISRYGLIGLMPSLEGLGILARSPWEIASLLAVIAGSDDKDPAMHAGAMPDFNRPAAGPPIRTAGLVGEALASLTGAERTAFETSVRGLAATGIVIREVNLPSLAEFTLVHRIVGAVEASSSCGKFDGVRYGHRAAGAKNWNEMYLATRAAAFGALMKGLLFQGAYLQFENYAAFEKAGSIRARLEAETQALLKDVEALILPTSRQETGKQFEGLRGIYEAGLFTLPANVLGLPALHVPGIVRDGSDDGGLQILGRRMADPDLLTLAGRLSKKG